jgi:hypothetical protein
MECVVDYNNALDLPISLLSWPQIASIDKH